MSYSRAIVNGKLVHVVGYSKMSKKRNSIFSFKEEKEEKYGIIHDIILCDNKVMALIQEIRKMSNPFCQYAPLSFSKDLEILNSVFIETLYNTQNIEDFRIIDLKKIQKSCGIVEIHKKSFLFVRHDESFSNET